MAAIANSLVSVRDSRFRAPSGGFTLKPSSDKSLVVFPPSSLSLSPLSRRKDGIASHKRQFVLRAAYRNDGRPNSASIFVGGFVLGGIVVGALACVYAPQISKALTETDKKELMRRLPKFIYDEEKALEVSLDDYGISVFKNRLRQTVLSLHHAILVNFCIIHFLT
ncbi:unnamed protein product [Musa textilis]